MSRRGGSCVVASSWCQCQLPLDAVPLDRHGSIARQMGKRDIYRPDDERHYSNGGVASRPTRPKIAEPKGRVRRGHSIKPMSNGALSDWFKRVEGRFMGEPISIHPHDAILWAMRVSAGEVAYCDQQIACMSEDELFERPSKVTYVEMPSGQIESITEVRDAEQLSRWVLWRDHAMKNMTTYAKMALDVGIEERQIALAEQQAQRLVAVISKVLSDLGHDLKDIRTREIVRQRLIEGSVEGTATEMMPTPTIRTPERRDVDNVTEAPNVTE